MNYLVRPLLPPTVNSRASLGTKVLFVPLSPLMLVSRIISRIELISASGRATNGSYRFFSSNLIHDMTEGVGEATEKSASNQTWIHLSDNFLPTTTWKSLRLNRHNFSEKCGRLLSIKGFSRYMVYIIGLGIRHARLPIMSIFETRWTPMRLKLLFRHAINSSKKLRSHRL